MSDCTPLIIKMRDLIKQSHIYLSHAPKHEKYVAVKQIKNLEWDIYLLIIECNKRYFKKTTLTELDVKHELLRNAWQLYYELGYLAYKDGHHDSDKTYPLHRLSVINTKVDEVGRMIGAWIKKEKDLIKVQSSDCQKL